MMKTVTSLKVLLWINLNPVFSQLPLKEDFIGKLTNTKFSKMGLLTIVSFLVVVMASASQAADFDVSPPFYAQRYAGVSQARGLLVDEFGDLLVVSKSPDIYALRESDNGDGTVSVQQVQVVEGSGLGLNHGIAYSNGFLYASSTTKVYRWPYTPGQLTLINASPETVVTNINNGGHSTRTLGFDSEGRLYVAIGSNANIDQNSDRARIRRFDGMSSLPSGGHQFNDGVVFADGLRNEVGFDFDSNGVLWGVENSGDQLNRPDFGDIHNGNPAEELNKFDGALGTKYGYPYCFSTYNLAGYEKNTQFAWPDFMNDGTHTDAWCNNQQNNRPPAMALPAHNAPLGIKFYDGAACGQVEGAFPCNMTGDAFVAYHGSWNSDIKVGYRVGWLPFENGNPTGEEINVITDKGNDGQFRPVNAVFNKNGHLFVSADSSGEVFKVTYGVPPKTIKN